MSDTPARAAAGRRQARSRPGPPGWQALRQRGAETQAATVRELFDSDPGRVRDFTVEGPGAYVDFSRHPITREALGLLVELAEQRESRERIAEMLAGDTGLRAHRRATASGSVPRRSGRAPGMRGQPAQHDPAIWDVDSFDQWGVELGKITDISGEPTAEQATTLRHDPSTNAPINRYRAARARRAASTQQEDPRGHRRTAR